MAETDTTETYDGPERRAATANDVLELKYATERLAEQVSTLSLALQAIGVLQQHQQELDARLSDISVVAEEQRDLAGNLLGTLEEIDAKSVSKDEVRHARRKFLAQLTVVLVVSGLILTGIGLFARSYVLGHNQSVQRVCEDRSRGAVAIHDYIDRQRALASARPLTSIQQHQLELLNTLEQGFPITDCRGIG